MPVPPGRLGENDAGIIEAHGVGVAGGTVAVGWAGAHGEGQARRGGAGARGAAGLDDGAVDWPGRGCQGGGVVHAQRRQPWVELPWVRVGEVEERELDLGVRGLGRCRGLGLGRGLVGPWGFDLGRLGRDGGRGHALAEGCGLRGVGRSLSYL